MSAGSDCTMNLLRNMACSLFQVKLDPSAWIVSLHEFIRLVPFEYDQSLAALTIISTSFRIWERDPYNIQQKPWGSQLRESGRCLAWPDASLLVFCRRSPDSWLECCSSHTLPSAYTLGTSSYRCCSSCYGRPNLMNRSVIRDTYRKAGL